MRLCLYLSGLCLWLTAAYAAEPGRPTSRPDVQDPAGIEKTDASAADREAITLNDGAADRPSVRIKADIGRGACVFLGWDTEGGDRTKHNLLREPLELRAVGDKWTLRLQGSAKRRGEREAVFELAADSLNITWSMRLHDGGLSMQFDRSGNAIAGPDRLDLVFPFDITTTATCPITGEWTREGKLRLPMLLHAPDIGTMRVDCTDQPGVLGRWEGSRTKRQATLTLELPIPAAGQGFALQVRPWHIPQPQSVADKDEWLAARRGWLNLYQLSTAQAAEGVRSPTPPGALGEQRHQRSGVQHNALSGRIRAAPSRIGSGHQGGRYPPSHD